MVTPGGQQRSVRWIPVLSPTEIRRELARTIASARDLGSAEPFRAELRRIRGCLDPLWLDQPPRSVVEAREGLAREAGAPVVALVASSALASLAGELPVRGRFPAALRALGRGTALRSRQALIVAWDDDERPAIGLAGSWPHLAPLIERISRLADEPIPVLVSGESGTGKELVAQGLHRLGRRRRERFLALNASELAETLLESELFGHVRGSFTGAVADRVGFFEAAGEGTAFLDEIGELSGTTQAKLLRVLEEHRVRPVGSNDFRPLDCRIVTATHRDLGRRLEEGSFRSDLFYRLRGAEIELPPLRERPHDLLALTERFVTRVVLRRDEPVELAAEARAALLAHSWPGNVRELRQAIDAAAAVSDGRIEARHLPLGAAVRAVVSESGDAPPTVADVERAHILRALLSADGNKASAARMLGLTRQSLQRRIARHGIELPPGIGPRRSALASDPGRSRSEDPAISRFVLRGTLPASRTGR